MERLVEATGATQRRRRDGHLAPDVAADRPGRRDRGLGDLVYFAAAKDDAILDGAKTKGVLDDEFVACRRTTRTRCRPGAATGATPGPTDPAWRFVAVGLGHTGRLLGRGAAALREVDPDITINIEHEDASMSVLDGLSMAARTLHAATAQL